MGMLAGTALFLIQHVIPRLPGKPKTLGIARMLMNWNIDDLTRHLHNNHIGFNQATAEILRGKGPIYTSKDFFELLGFDDYQDVDIDPSSGCSIIHDLNQPLPPQYENCFDFVIENGTIEHIFDIKAVVGNIAKSVKTGGTICHISPLDALNHGFYNFSVNFFNDFYKANGFEERQFYLLRNAADWEKDQTVLVEAFPYTHLEFYITPEVHRSPYNKLYLGFIAKKKRHFDRTVIPIQAVYDPSLGLSGHLRSR